MIATAQVTLTSLYDGEKGIDAILAVLSNDSHVVPTDDEGLNGNYAGASSSLIIYNGATEDTKNWKITAKLDNVEGALVGNTFTVSKLINDTGNVTFTATRTGYSTLTRVFGLSKSKSGVKGADSTAYFLEVDANVIQRQGENKELNPTSISIYGNSKKGTNDIIAQAGYFTIYEQSRESFSIDKYTRLVLNNEDESGREYVLSKSS